MALPTGLVEGFSAVIPTNDYWMRRQEEVQLRTQEQARAAAQQKQMEDFEKNVASIYSEKVDPTLHDAYNKKMLDISNKIYDRWRTNGGKMDKDMYDLLREGRTTSHLYEGLSQNVDDFKKTDVKNLTREGQFVQKKIAAGLSFDKLQKEYQKEFPDSQVLLPLGVNESGVVDFNNFKVDPTDYFKDLSEAKPFLNKETKSTIDPYSQSKIVEGVSYYPELKTDYSNPFQTKEGVIEQRLLNNNVFAKYAKDYASALTAEYKKRTAGMGELPPEEKLNIQRDILKSFLMRDIKTKREDFSRTLGKPPKTNINVNANNPNNQTGYYHTISNAARDEAPKAVQAVVSSGGNGQQAYEAYGNAIGVGYGDFNKAVQKYPNFSVNYDLPKPSPAMTAKFASGTIAPANINKVVIGNSSYTDIGAALKAAKLSEYEIEEVQKYLTNGANGNLDKEFIRLQTPDGSDATYAEVAADPNIMAQATPILSQRFTLKAPNGAKSSLASGLAKLKNASFYTEFDISNQDPSTLEYLREGETKYVKGKPKEARVTSQPKTTTPAVTSKKKIAGF